MATSLFETSSSPNSAGVCTCRGPPSCDPPDMCETMWNRISGIQAFPSSVSESLVESWRFAGDASNRGTCNSSRPTSHKLLKLKRRYKLVLSYYLSKRDQLHTWTDITCLGKLYTGTDGVPSLLRRRTSKCKGDAPNTARILL